MKISQVFTSILIFVLALTSIIVIVEDFETKYDENIDVSDFEQYDSHVDDIKDEMKDIQSETENPVGKIITSLWGFLTAAISTIGLMFSSLASITEIFPDIAKQLKIDTRLVMIITTIVTTTVIIASINWLRKYEG